MDSPKRFTNFNWLIVKRWQLFAFIFSRNTPYLLFYREPFQFQKANIFFLVRICLKFQGRDFLEGKLSRKKQGRSSKSRRATSMIFTFFFFLVKEVSTFVSTLLPLKHSETRWTNQKDLLLGHPAQDGPALLTKRKGRPKGKQTQEENSKDLYIINFQPF